MKNMCTYDKDVSSEFKVPLSYLQVAILTFDVFPLQDFLVDLVNFKTSGIVSYLFVRMHFLLKFWEEPLETVHTFEAFVCFKLCPVCSQKK